MHTATHRHERTPERESIDRPPNLHEAAGFEERGRFRPDDVAPSAFSGAFPELRRELNLYRLFGCHMLNLVGAPILQSTGCGNGRARSASGSKFIVAPGARP